MVLALEKKTVKNMSKMPEERKSCGEWFYVMKWEVGVVWGCRRLPEDLGLAASVFADLMMEEAKPSFKKTRLLGIAYPQGCSLDLIWEKTRVQK